MKFILHISSMVIPSSNIVSSDDGINELVALSYLLQDPLLIDIKPLISQPGPISTTGVIEYISLDDKRFLPFFKEIVWV